MRDSGAAVGERLAGDEEVLATGRCADITTTGDLDSGGAGWTYVMITNRHCIGCRVSGCLPRSVLDLDKVASCTEVLWRHRSAVIMDHLPIVRPHFLPNGRPLHWVHSHGLGCRPAFQDHPRVQPSPAATSEVEGAARSSRTRDQTGSKPDASLTRHEPVLDHPVRLVRPEIERRRVPLRASVFADRYPQA
jgi:hypothetical protein